MTTTLSTIPVRSTLATGWKYLFTSWSVFAVLIVSLMIYSWLFPAASVFAPSMLLKALQHSSLGIWGGYVFAGLLMAVPIFYLASAIFLAIRSMVRKQGGLSLFLTSIFGSYIFFWIGALLFFLSGGG